MEASTHPCDDQELPLGNLPSATCVRARRDSEKLPLDTVPVAARARASRGSEKLPLNTCECPSCYLLLPVRSCHCAVPV